MDARRRNISGSVSTSYNGSGGDSGNIGGNYTIRLNDHWQKSATITNPDATLYDGVYENCNNTTDSSRSLLEKMYIDINGYTNFKLYFRYTGSTLSIPTEWVMVSHLDKYINIDTEYSDTSVVKAYATVKQAGNTISDYTLVEYNNIDGGPHRITIAYIKISIGGSSGKKGQLIIPKGGGNIVDTIDPNSYLTIVALEDGLTASLSRNACEYCINGSGDWISLDADTPTTSIDMGQTLSFKNDFIYDNIGVGTFTISKKCNLEGNCMSILFGDNAMFDNSYAFSLMTGVISGLFSGCTNIVEVADDFLPYKKFPSSCGNMFYGCTSLTKAPKLPATSISINSYSSMFSGCSSLVTPPPVLPATSASVQGYQYMFSNCSSLTYAPIISATSVRMSSMNGMFYHCSNLTTAPILLSKTLVDRCYADMFNGCSNLNYIKMLATDMSDTNCLRGWVSGVSDNGTFIKNIAMTDLPTGASGIPVGWIVQDDYIPTSCTKLTITADDVQCRDTTTTIYYTAVTNGVDLDGKTVKNVTITGTATSTPFAQNTSTTNTVQRTISYTYLGKTATTTITQDVWKNSYYTIDLNNQWQKSTTASNPDTTEYDGVYESFSNYNIGSTAAIMKVIIDGYSSFKFYIRSYAESSFDYVMVSQLDQTIDNNTSNSNTTLVKAHTRGNQQSGTALSNYTPVEFTNIGGGKHVITIVYRKDGGGNSGTDKGYVLIPKIAGESSGSGGL